MRFVRLVHCVKLGRELPGLDAPPWPGPLGQRIYEQISAEAWELWEERMKMILNEYRLLPFQKESQSRSPHTEEFLSAKPLCCRRWHEVKSARGAGA
jgi:Fe-S cluster biosynthesis and repair protein YggX